MALLDESNLLAERARQAKFRVNHVGTKLHETELHELAALVGKRKMTPAELIRGLILREIARDKQPTPEVRPSVELEELTALRLLVINVLPRLAMGETMTLAMYEDIQAEIAKRKSSRSLELLQEWEKARQCQALNIRAGVPSAPASVKALRFAPTAARRVQNAWP